MLIVLFSTHNLLNIALSKCSKRIAIHYKNDSLKPKINGWEII